MTGGLRRFDADTLPDGQTTFRAAPVARGESPVTQVAGTEPERLL